MQRLVQADMKMSAWYNTMRWRSSCCPNQLDNRYSFILTRRNRESKLASQRYDERREQKKFYDKSPGDTYPMLSYRACYGPEHLLIEEWDLGVKMRTRSSAKPSWIKSFIERILWDGHRRQRPTILTIKQKKSIGFTNDYTLLSLTYSVKG